MEIPKTYQIAVRKMLKGSKVRLNQKGRDFFLDENTQTRGDVWSYVTSVNCDKTVNLCSKNHLLRSNVHFDFIAW